MAKKLTTKSVENAKPGPQRREISDGGSGLYLILQPSGHRSWAVRYRANGEPTKLTLGSWPALTLAGARKAAAEALHELERGNDPTAARRAAKNKAAAACADTVTAICEEYLRREGKKLRTVDQRVSILKRLVYPAIGDRPIDTIKRSEIIRLLDKIEDNNGQRMADVTLAVIRKIFNWHATRSDDFRSPVVFGMGRQNVAEHRRSRILEDHELRAIWTATTADKEPFAALVRFLLVSAARRGEAAGMRWDEIDADGIWTLPASRNKTKIELLRPLSKKAQAILAEQPQIDDCPFVFTSNGLRPIASFSGPKEKVDARSGVSNWTVHDLRRTSRSLMSRAGVNPDIAERALGHVIPGVRGVYDRHQYRAEMLHVFEALAAEIDRIVHPPEGDVIQLRGRR
jgi:integrase